MDLYRNLAKKPTFSISEIEELGISRQTAYYFLNSMIKKSLARKIRNNIYSIIDPSTGQIYANRYQIACAITDTAYISHHSAFEYYGLANQVYYEVYVSSKTRFNPFEYEGIDYKYITSRIDEGVIEAKNTIGIRITDLERTVIDSINDFNKIGGFEELLNCISGIHYIDEKKLRDYLDIYDRQVLYQRTGYILNQFKMDIILSDEFIEYCKKKIGFSKRYLINDLKENNILDKDWNLMVPRNIFEVRGQGDDILV